MLKMANQWLGNPPRNLRLQSNKTRHLGVIHKTSLTLFTAASLIIQSAAFGAQPAAHLDTNKLKLASVHAAVAELESGRTLFTKDAHRSVPVASISKLMTAMVVLDSGANMDEWLRVKKRVIQPPVKSHSRIRRGSELQRRNLLRIMLMSSENLAAYTLAANYKGGFPAFIKAMNAKAKTLGMTHTHWVNPSGLSKHNQASAADVVKMVTAAAGYKTIRAFTQTGYYTAVFRHPRYALNYGNTDPLVHRAKWDIRLTKTGYLNVAGQCLAVVANIDGKDIVMVMLDSFGRHSPLGDVSRITRWLRTGSGGKVARAARTYEQRKTQQYMLADKAAKTYVSLAAAAAKTDQIKEPTDATSSQLVNLTFAGH